MNRIVPIVVILASAFLVGCAEPQHGVRTRTRPESKLVGFVLPGDAAKPYRLLDLKDVTIHGRPATPDIPGRKRIKTRYILKLSVINEPEDQDFDVFFGPYPGSNKEVSGRIKHSTSTFEADSGWALAQGDDPEVETDWVAAGVEGSTLLVQIVDTQLTPNDKHVHRVFLLSLSPDRKAWARTSAEQLDPWKPSGTYIEVDKNGEIDGPFEIALAAQEIKDFVDLALEIAGATP